MSLRVDARYRLLTGDFDLVDRASDALMEALMVREGVTNQDVAVSMTEPSLEIWFDVPTDNVVEAMALGAQVLAEVFTAAGLTPGASFGVAVGDTTEAPVLVADADLHAEPVPA